VSRFNLGDLDSLELLGHLRHIVCMGRGILRKPERWKLTWVKRAYSGTSILLGYGALGT